MVSLSPALAWLTAACTAPAPDVTKVRFLVRTWHWADDESPPALPFACATAARAVLPGECSAATATPAGETSPNASTQAPAVRKVVLTIAVLQGSASCDCHAAGLPSEGEA